jgi:hypothetical protein
MAAQSRHISVHIDRPADVVYEYTANPTNLPHWASGLGGSIAQVDGCWVADSPMGQVVVTFAGRNPFGVLDHDVTLPSGETVYNPMRVIPDGNDEAFEADADTVTADLAALKQLLERSPDSV